MYGAYYNQQGGTGRKRKRSKSQKKSSKQQTNQRHNQFQFDVDIPDYYHRDMPLRLHSTTISNGQSKGGGGHQVDRQKMSLGDFMDYSSTTAKQKQDDTPAHAAKKENDDAAGGKSPEEIKVDTQGNKDVATIDKQDKQTLMTEGVKDDDAPQAKKDNDVVEDGKSPEKTNLAHQKQSKYSPVKGDIQVRNDQGAEVKAEDPKSKRHKDFINALERYGSSDRAWDKISYHLKWTVKDVKVYAYSYFKSLIKDRTVNIYEKMDLSIIANAQGFNNSTSSKATSDEDTTEDEWTFHELILLDSLMVKYCKNISCLAEEMNNGTWEKIASQLPGRSAHTCKKEGIKRLLSLYGE